VTGVQTCALPICWHLYSGDNNDYVPPNSFVYDLITDQPLDTGPSWCTNLAPFEADPDGIVHGMLFRYNSSLGIYHCPADTSKVQTRTGVSLDRTRLRTYNMSQSLNGPKYDDPIAGAIPCFQKFTQIQNPTPSRLLAFIDVHENEILDTQFGIPVRITSGYRDSWWDVPANRHNQGCNFSFADGHAEHWKWKVPKNVTVPRGNVQPIAPGEMDDFMRMEGGFKQDFN